MTPFAVAFGLLMSVRVCAQTPPVAVARVMVGLEQTAAGSAAPVQKAAIGLFFTHLKAKFEFFPSIFL